MLGVGRGVGQSSKSTVCPSDSPPPGKDRERAPVPHEGGCREEAAEEADRPAMDAIPDEATEPSSAFPHRLSATQSGVSIVRRLPLSHLGPRAGTEPSSDPTAACLAAVYKRLVEHSLLSAVTGKGK